MCGCVFVCEGDDEVREAKGVNEGEVGSEEKTPSVFETGREGVFRAVPLEAETEVLIWSLFVHSVTGDVVVDDSNNMFFLSVVNSGVVACRELGFMGSGRGWGGVKGRPLGLLMIRRLCPNLLREFQGFWGRELGTTLGDSPACGL